MKEQLLKLEQVFTKAKGERVELGLVDDVQKLFKQTQNEFKKIDSKRSALKKEMDKALIHTVNIDGQTQKIIKQAKELGVGDLVKEMNTLKDKAEKLQKEYKPLYDALK